MWQQCYGESVKGGREMAAAVAVTRMLQVIDREREKRKGWRRRIKKCWQMEGVRVGVEWWKW